MIQNILCIHDNEYFIKALSNILLRYDLFASGFTDFKEAEDFADKFRSNIDLIIVDRDAGGKGNGFGIVSKIRKRTDISAPVIGLVTKLDSESLESAEEMEINLLLPKNIDEKSLMNHIRKFEALWDVNNPSKIVIAEPDEFRRKKNLYELKGGNFKVLGTGDCKSCIETAGTEKPDLIVLSDELGSPDIFETIRALKSEKKTADIPVIMLSDKINAEMKRKGIMSGAVGFRKKTVDSGDFLWYISDILNNMNEKNIRPDYIFRTSDYVSCS